MKLGERLLNTVAKQPYTADQVILEVTASCGIADTLSSTDFDALLINARKALLIAKRNRSGEIEIFDPQAAYQPGNNPKTDSTN